MKILLINWQDPRNPRAGGAEIHLSETFRRIQQRGNEVVWLTSAWSGAAPIQRVDGMEVHRTGTRYTFGAASVLYYRQRLESRDFEVVVEALNKVPVYAPLWCRSPVVLLVHHLFGTTAFEELPLPLATLAWLQERPLARVYATRPVQAISQSTRNDLIDRGLRPENIRVITPGTDLEFFYPPASPIRPATPTFLYLGRLQKYKRVDLILEAFAGLLRDVGSARLVVAGSGDQEHQLRAAASRLGVTGSVYFAGRVSEEEKREWFQQAWANILVSPKEGWGITILEAAACGTASIASDSPGLREAVRDGTTGLLVPHGDASALAAALARLARNPELVEQLGRAARRSVEGFSWENTAAQTEDHLVEVLREPSLVTGQDRNR